MACSFNFSQLDSWSQALTSVLPKEGKDKKLCSSSRPISILNEEYKLSASILARRLDSFIPELIDGNQKGSVRGRQTQDNIRCTFHVLHHIRMTQTLLTGMDVEKVFHCTSIKKISFSGMSINFIRSLRLK